MKLLKEAGRVRPCPTCRDRGDFPELLVERGLTKRGVEVGVRKGCFAQIILANWPGTLHLVDPWEDAPSDYKEYQKHDSDGTWDDQADYALTLGRMEPFGERAVVHKTTSWEAAEHLVPNGIDFAYIDADHRYGHVRQDCRLWWAKLRRGGILAGHDFLYFEQMEVTRAVINFASDWESEIFVIRGSSDNVCRDGQVAGWYMVKE